MLDFNQLSPLMRDLHAECVTLYYLMLPPFFALAVALQWFRKGQGAVDYVDLLKRTIISTLLLIAFPEISDAIISISEGIASRIDSLDNLDKFLSIAQQKIDSYTLSPKSILLGFNDLFLATLTFLSFLVLYVMRYLTLAMFHFVWLFLVVTAPLLLLFNIFAGTSQIVVHLFRGLIEVACWKIVWAILGVMLASLSFGQMYLVEGSYVTVIVMNFVIAVAMIATPLLVRSLVGSGMHSVSPVIAPTAARSIVTLPTKAQTATRLLRPQQQPPQTRTNNNSSSRSIGKERRSEVKRQT